MGGVNDVQLTCRHGTVRLAKGVSTGDQSDGLLIVHSHAIESDADVLGRSGGVGAGIGALRVDVDETHVGGTQGLLELVGALVDVGAAIVADIVTLGDEGRLSTPVDGLIGLPSIGTASGEAKRGEAHGLKGNVAGEEVQVGP